MHFLACMAAVVSLVLTTIQPATAQETAAAVLGFSSAFAAYGAFYLSCIIVTWWYYSRKNAPMPC